MYTLDRKYRWYAITLLGKDFRPEKFVFRGLTSAELRIGGTKDTELEAENFFLYTVVLGERDWDQMPAGTSRVLLEQIYHYSGVTSDLIWEEGIAWLLSQEGSLEACTVSMIPGLDLEKLRSADPFDKAKYLLIGKYMFETLYKVPVSQAFEAFDPNKRAAPKAVGPQTFWPTKDGKPGPGAIGLQTEEFGNTGHVR